ncbi:uracil-DNA glycosylase [Desulforhabdus amnigena]|jgi:DNA polymerase|uniref:Type-4 uracil-DNA glycosylase n=1 Tax=Desulforhabdus amnigena TaxID=40218 RepID=A0A9W6L8Z4_9BACT|nr:uracil-DNA glycosylase [Desulforhabdus amnigena]NLJ29465.1 uracil-DNA glycosylase [Deltaproteobacteria bacterium]GLI36147.1 uracil-DNA glycosylase [Desulforhabdus amnigena]
MTAAEQKALKLMDLYARIIQDPQYRSRSMGDIFVPGVGLFEENTIVFIGEAPGREEEKERLPFVGPAGKNLDILLEEIGLSRKRVFITNLVKYRPFTPKGENRRPTARESRYALPYLLQELEILAPPLVVCLGLSAAKTLLMDENLKMEKANGNFYTIQALRILVTYHPSPFNYRNPQKRDALHMAFSKIVPAGF